MKKASRVPLALLTALFLMPIAALALLSCLPPQIAQAVFRQDFSAFGSFHFSTEQFVRALNDRAYGQQFGNSVLMTSLSTALFLPVALTAGLFLSRLPRRWQRALLALYIFSLLSPFQIIMLPIYKLSLLTGLYNNHWSVILLNIFAPIGPLTVCVLLQTIDGSQWEAASLETDSALQILRYVLLPQILPGLSALGLLVFAQAWNMVEQPLILLSDARLRPLSTAFNDIIKSNTDYAFAGGLLYALPMLAFYLIAVCTVGRQRKKPENQAAK